MLLSFSHLPSFTQTLNTEDIKFESKYNNRKVTENSEDHKLFRVVLTNKVRPRNFR